EGAQIALASGVTGMFSTWLAQDAARRARDLIRAGEAPGCRIYTGGNIVGFDGLFSPDLLEGAAPYVSRSFVERTNREWERGVGRDLMWLAPEQVRPIMREYLAAGDLDYMKYAACGHWLQGGHLNAHFLTFSPRVQRVLINEAHDAGL